MTLLSRDCNPAELAAILVGDHFMAPEKNCLASWYLKAIKYPTAIKYA